MNHTTDDLAKVLISTEPEELGAVLAENAGRMAGSFKPFSGYFKELLRLHGKTQQSVIRKAGFSDKYGYRLLSEESHTRQRDYILRLCLAAELSLDELQRVLRLYGMAPLYARTARDAVIISAVSHGIFELDAINELLTENGQTAISLYSE